MFFKNKAYLVNDKQLDKYQTKAVKCNLKRYLVVAGAGSGKTLTIVGKVKYLIEECGLKQKDIICISFTNESVNSLINSLEKSNLKIDVKTFHKLALDIINLKKYSIASSTILDYIIEEYFTSIIYFENDYKLLSLYLNDNYYKYDEFIFYFKKTTSFFIKTFKANDYSLSFFYSLLFNKNIDVDERILLTIIFKIYILYQEELNSYGVIDFDDMLSLSIDAISKKDYFKYKYIIIDEFQDTSLVRYNLIKKIIEKFDVSLMAVGDDYQSIYSFNGCDIELFLNFKKNFSNSKIIKLKNTYRNPKDIVDISSRFIIKNKKQIKKKLISKKYIYKSIIIVYSKNISNDFVTIVKDLDNILVLGRNNNDIKLLLNNEITCDNLKNIYIKNFTKNIRYLTVHSSKGLEEENVIILNVTDNTLGFPNKIKENNLLKYLKKDNDNFLYSEERRLFYVALTRTKNKVYIFTSKKNPSIFVTELLKDYKAKLKIIDFEEKDFK